VARLPLSRGARVSEIGLAQRRDGDDAAQNRRMASGPGCAVSRLWLRGVAQGGSRRGRKLAGKEEADKDKKADEEYYELLKLFVDALDQVERNYVKDVSRRELVEAAIEGMLSKLDQHTGYIAPDDLDRFRSGVESEFGGLGIQVSVENGKLIIVSPLVDTPAYRLISQRATSLPTSTASRRRALR